MTIELPTELEVAIKVRADACGIAPDTFVREVLKQALVQGRPEEAAPVPFKSSYGMLAKYGPAPTDEEMEENRAEMLRNFSEDF
jgi:hypothetical protein